MLLQRHRPLVSPRWSILAFVLTGLWQPGFNRIETARSFFGVHQVVGNRRRPPPVALSRHDDPRRRAPVRWRCAGEIAAGAADLLLFRRADLADASKPRAPRKGGLGRVAVVGLGTGSLACHRRKRRDVDVLRDRSRGRPDRQRSALLQLPVDMRTGCRIVLGDARLTLAAATQRYDSSSSMRFRPMPSRSIC